MKATDGVVLSRGAKDGMVGRVTLLSAALFAVIALGAVAVLARGAGSVSAPMPVREQALPSAAQLAVSREIGAAASRFWTVKAQGGLRALNAPQDFQLSFKRAGLQVGVPGGQVGLSLAALGRGDRLTTLPPPALAASANSVSYTRRGLVEWYANGPLGLEQGLRLKAAPAPGTRGELSIAYTLSGGSRALLQDGQLTFRGANGAPLVRYGGLTVRDVVGRQLPAGLQLDGSRLLIKVDDAGARYPLSVDPVFVRPTVAPFASALARLGPASLALSSSTAISLSLAPLNSAQKAYGTADEGVSAPLLAKVTITNAPGDDTVSGLKLTPDPLQITPTTALTATGAPNPAPPSALAPGASASFIVPYKIAAAGQATLAASLTWSDGTGIHGPLTQSQTVDLGSGVSGTVFNTSCGDTSCSRSGLSGGVILATGAAADGTAIVKTATTANDGQRRHVHPPASGGHVFGWTLAGFESDRRGRL